MASAAVARRFRTVLLRHHVLDALEDRVHRGIAVRAGFPLVVDLRVASARAAALRTGERSGIECAIGGGMRQARRKGAVGAERIAVVGRKPVLILRPRVGGTSRPRRAQFPRPCVQYSQKPSPTPRAQSESSAASRTQWQSAGQRRNAKKSRDQVQVAQPGRVLTPNSACPVSTSPDS